MLIASASVGVVLTPVLILGSLASLARDHRGADRQHDLDDPGPDRALVYLEKTDNPLAFGKLRHYLGIEMPL